MASFSASVVLYSQTLPVRESGYASQISGSGVWPWCSIYLC